MSEYQYYEFQAIDRPLTAKEMQTLRSYSTRAEITPTTFKNEYNWGDFKGNPNQWMEKYFDAYLYFANWGTREVQLNLPISLLDPKIVRQYCAGDSASMRVKGGNIIISLSSENEGGDEWGDDDYGLSGIISVRAELAIRDYRALYLGWLLCVHYDDVKNKCVEPPIPPGLRKLSGSLESFVTFLRLDRDLLHVAAQNSQPLKRSKPTYKEMLSWVAKLPVAEKNRTLTQLVFGKDADLPAQLLQRYLREHGLSDGVVKKPMKQRTVGELREAAEELVAGGTRKRFMANE